MHDYDRSSKWLIQHHGDSILRLGGVRQITSWRPLQAEVVQPRRLPDGLLEAQLAEQSQANLFLLELTTYPERRVALQIVRDTMLVYLDREVLPEVLVVVLCPRGNVRVTDAFEMESPLGWTRHQCSWRVVELWTLPAEQLLAANDVGLIPWVPLTQFDGPPEPILQQCRERIDQQAPPNEHANFLAVAQVLARLRYNVPGLLDILGGSKIMIESPLIQEIVSRTKHSAIVRFLAARFGPVPQDIVTILQTVSDEQRLDELVDWAGRCPDLDAFRTQLSA